MANRSRMNLGNRYQQQYDSRDDGGARRGDVVQWGKAPTRKFFKAELEGARNKINIIPYEIKSKNHPEVAAGRAKVGDWDFVLDVWVHRSLGPNKVDILCPKKTLGKRCPACEESSRLYDAKKDSEGKALKASRRVFYNVQPFDKGGPSDEVQIFAVSHYLFAKELMEEANACANGKGVVPFADPDKGKVVSFRASEEKIGTNTSVGYKSFQFLDRDEEISDEILDQAISFDQFLIIPTAEDVEAAMYGTDEPAGDTSGQDADETTQERGGNQQAEAEEETGSRRGRRSEPEQEPEPENTGRRSSRKADEDMIVDCPKGYNFGSDRDKKPGCSRCPDNVYEACQRAGKK